VAALPELLLPRPPQPRVVSVRHAAQFSGEGLRGYRTYVLRVYSLEFSLNLNPGRRQEAGISWVQETSPSSLRASWTVQCQEDVAALPELLLPCPPKPRIVSVRHAAVTKGYEP